LDVSFGEDACRVRRDHAPANLSVIRRFTSGLLKREMSSRRGIETKRLKCAASDEYGEKALFDTRDKMRFPWERPLLVPIVNSTGDYLERPLLVVPDLVTPPDDNSSRVREIKTSARTYSD
jgi:hypothetical protein